LLEVFAGAAGVRLPRSTRRYLASAVVLKMGGRENIVEFGAADQKERPGPAERHD
jgi:hypothetical protein